LNDELAGGKVIRIHIASAAGFGLCFSQ